MVAEHDNSETEEVEFPLTVEQVRTLARDSLLQLRKFAGEIAKLDPETTDGVEVEHLLDMLGEEING